MIDVEKYDLNPLQELEELIEVKLGPDLSPDDLHALDSSLGKLAIDRTRMTPEVAELLQHTDHRPIVLYGGAEVDSQPEAA